MLHSWVYAKDWKGKLWSLQHYYFSLIGDEQDTFGDEQDTYLLTHLQMVSGKTSDISISFEYYLFTVQQCSRVAFKIALRVSNMSLHRVQLRVLNGDSNIETDNAPNMKGT